jgi:hypothetical protein
LPWPQGGAGMPRLLVWHACDNAADEARSREELAPKCATPTRHETQAYRTTAGLRPAAR